jgi:hypothetical protein
MTTTTKDTGWVVTKDHDPEFCDRKGFGMGLNDVKNTIESHQNVVGRTIFISNGMNADDIPSDKRVKWRSFSDDGDPTYDGIIHFDWLLGEVEGTDPDDDLGFELDRWNIEDAGATVVVYNVADIIRCDESKRNWVENHPRMAHPLFLRTAGIDPKAWIGIYG